MRGRFTLRDAALIALGLAVMFAARQWLAPHIEMGRAAKIETHSQLRLLTRGRGEAAMGTRQT